MDLDHLQIGIVGAGIGGLALAALLAQAGAKVQVIVRFTAARAIGSRLVVQPVGMAVLDAVGVGEQALALGQPIHRMQGWTAKKLVPEAEYKSGSAGIGMHRAALHQILWQAMTDRGAQVLLGQKVVGHLGGQDHELAICASGQRLKFDLLVDASGTGSVLSPMPTRVLPFGAVWGTVPWPEDTHLSPNRLTQRYERAERMAGFLPIGRLAGSETPLAAVFWSLPAADLARWPDQSAADFAGWLDELRGFWPELAPFLRTLREPGDLTPARYSHGALRRFHQGRLVFLGDAAHRASPQLGQGANMALQIALSLARALRAAGDEDTGLALHQRTRRAHVWTYQGISALLTPLYQSLSRILSILRDHLLAPVSRLAAARGLISALVSGALIPPLRGQVLPASAFLGKTNR